MSKHSIPLIITYALTHLLMFLAWTQLLYMGIFAEKIDIYGMIAIVAGAALATIQGAAIVRDVEYTLDHN